MQGVYDNGVSSPAARFRPDRLLCLDASRHLCKHFLHLQIDAGLFHSVQLSSKIYHVLIGLSSIVHGAYIYLGYDVYSNVRPTWTSQQLQS